jgi:NitT/TauT family transport system substrate-binding protein
MRFLKFAKAAAAGALALTVFAAAANAEPIKIRMSWVAPIANWGSLVMAKKDLATHMGKSYTLETVRYQGTPQMITAIANNELEVASLAYSSLGLAIENAGLDMRVIADEFQDGVPGRFSTEFYVRKDANINKVEDLKGKIIGTNGAGSAVDIAVRAMLKKHGLEDKRDYTMLEGPLPAMPAMLLEKKADLIPGVLPFALNPKLKQDGKILFHQRDALGVTQMIVLAARKSFIDAHRAAMVDYMEDMLRIVHWYLDPQNHDAAAKIASEMTKVPPERFGWLFTKADAYKDPNMVPDLDALQRNVDATQQLGFIKQKLDVKKYADLSLVKEAMARLKK